MKLFGPVVRAILWLLAAAVLTVARVHPAIHHFLLALSRGLTADQLRSYVAAWGPLAPAVSVAVMVVQTFLPFPADPLIVANGAVFGVWKGLAVSVAGALLSGAVAFGLGRESGRRAVLRFIPRSVAERVDTAVRDGTWASALLLQFVPGIPFSLLNFLLGTTTISWNTFLWTLGLSILPSDVALVLLGRGVAEGQSALNWTIAALVLLAAAAIFARRWLARTVHADRPAASAS